MSIQSTASLLFNVYGSITSKKFFPADQPFPKPGQYAYVSSEKLGVPFTLVKITSVKTTLVNTELYQVEVQFNRVSLTEDILFARLARRQVDLSEQDQDFTEPLLLSDQIAITDGFEYTVLTWNLEYSGANYSGATYSGAV